MWTDLVQQSGARLHLFTSVWFVSIDIWLFFVCLFVCCCCCCYQWSSIERKIHPGGGRCLLAHPQLGPARPYRQILLRGNWFLLIRVAIFRPTRSLPEGLETAIPQYCTIAANAGRAGAADPGAAARPGDSGPRSRCRIQSGRHGTPPPPGPRLRRPRPQQTGRHRRHQEAAAGHPTRHRRVHPAGNSSNPPPSTVAKKEKEKSRALIIITNTHTYTHVINKARIRECGTTIVAVSEECNWMRLCQGPVISQRYSESHKAWK